MKKIINTMLLAFSLLLLTAPPVLALEGSPIAENMELETYRGICMEGQLKATDPQGDALSFQITTPPIKGEVLLNEDGSFLYTPREGKRGKDYFGYTATDNQGNVSQEATVIITLIKQRTEITYTDLKQSGLHYDALRLAEAGVFTGEQLGGQYLFSPNTSITHGEFLSICMMLNGTNPFAAVSSTGFADDDLIPPWEKPYIAAALSQGVIRTDTQWETPAFCATAPISFAQAAVLISDAFSLSDVHAAQFTASAPSWAVQALSNLSACNILPKTVDAGQQLTRADMAATLSALMDVLEER